MKLLKLNLIVLLIISFGCQDDVDVTQTLSLNEFMELNGFEVQFSESGKRKFIGKGKSLAEAREVLEKYSKEISASYERDSRLLVENGRVEDRFCIDDVYEIDGCRTYWYLCTDDDGGNAFIYEGGTYC